VIIIAGNYGYSSKVMDIFRHPHNIGEIKDADAVGKVGNPSCGDLMWMYLKMGRNKRGEEIIKDAKVKTFGCVAAISTSSVLTDLIKGKTLKEALEVSKQDIVDVLEGLPSQKIHCSILAIDALREAVYEYYRKKGRVIPKELRDVHEKNEMIKKALEHHRF